MNGKLLKAQAFCILLFVKEVFFIKFKSRLTKNCASKFKGENYERI